MDIKLARELEAAKDIPWNSRHKKMPPNDYGYLCLVVFNDGHLARSDGGTVHDFDEISLWKKNIARGGLE